MSNKIYVFEQGNTVYQGNLLTPEQKAMAVAVDVLPEPEEREGKIAIRRANLQTQKVYYEYIDAPVDEEEELRQNVSNLQSTVDTLLMAQLLGGK